MQFRPITTYSGYVLNDTNTSDPPIQAEWDANHDSTDGTSATANLALSELGARATHKGGKTDDYEIARVFIAFDTSALDGETITSARLWVYGLTNADSEICVQEGTQANPVTTADFDSFTGSYFGVTSGYTVSQWNEIVLDASGIASINKTGNTYFCLREYDHDYLDVMMDDTAYDNGLFIEGGFSHNIILEVNADSQLVGSGVLKTETQTITPVALTSDDPNYPFRICGIDNEVYGIPVSANLNEYNGANDYLPADVNLDYPWDEYTAGGGGTVTVENDASCINGKRLNFAVPSGGFISHYFNQRSGDPIENISNVNGYVIIWRAKVISSGATEGQSVYVEDDAYEWKLTMNDANVVISSSYISGADISYVIDTTDDYHVYQVCVKGTAFTLSVDGIVAIEAVLDNSTISTSIRFGDWSTTAGIDGQVYWDYIKYYNSYPLHIEGNDGILRVVAD